MSHTAEAYQEALDKICKEVAGGGKSDLQACPPSPHECPAPMSPQNGYSCRACWKEWALNIPHKTG
jgi:hypothetical protein